MTGDPRKRPSVASRFTKACQKCVAQAVQNERAHRLEAVLRGFYGDHFKRFLVLLLRLEDSTWPLRVGADQIQPSAGFPAASQRPSRIPRTRGVIGSTRRAAVVLPCVTSSVP